MTSRMTPLLEHNGEFARTYTPVPLGVPAARVIVVTCLDHRVDPAITLGLELGDAPVLRNAPRSVRMAMVASGTQPVRMPITLMSVYNRNRRVPGRRIEGARAGSLAAPATPARCL